MIIIHGNIGLDNELEITGLDNELGVKLVLIMNWEGSMTHYFQNYHSIQNYDLFFPPLMAQRSGPGVVTLHGKQEWQEFDSLLGRAFTLLLE